MGFKSPRSRSGLCTNQLSPLEEHVKYVVPVCAAIVGIVLAIVAREALHSIGIW